MASSNGTDNINCSDVIPFEVHSLFPVPFLNNDNYSQLVHFFVIPTLCILIVVFNSTSLLIFSKFRVRSPSHLLLCSLAVCDLVTAISLGAIELYDYLFEDYLDYMPFRICIVHTFLYNFIPVLSHYTATWLTVGLAVQRYICIVYPFKTKQICSQKNTIVFVVLAYLCSFAYFVFQIYTHNFSEVMVDSYYRHNVTVSACSIFISDFKFWYIHPLMFILLPFVILVCLEPAILRELKISRNMRSTTMNSSFNSTSRNISIITLWIAFIYLLAEIPVLVYVLGVFLCLEFHTFCSVLSSYPWLIFTHICLITPAIGCCSNFFIYIATMKVFRKILIDMISKWTCKPKKKLYPNNTIANLSEKESWRPCINSFPQDSIKTSEAWADE